MRIPVILQILSISAFAGKFSGIILDQSNLPVKGVTVQSSGSGTTKSDARGYWSLGGGTQIGSKEQITSKVTPHLLVRDGRIGLRWNNNDASGRSLKPTQMNLPKSAIEATRSMDGSDYLIFMWGAKHLIRLPVSRDSSGINYVIDTAWSDDYGISWNPHIQYGSLLDSRDHHVYRTVKIGNQTWMAENLYWTPPSGSPSCYNDLTACPLFGQLYSWEAAMVTGMGAKPTSAQGNCPSDWHVPSRDEWNTMIAKVEADPSVGSGGASTALTSTTYWTPNVYGSNGTDQFGFRALGGGEILYVPDLGLYNRSIQIEGFWWTSTMVGNSACYRYFAPGGPNIGVETEVESYSTNQSFLSVRCIKN